MTVKDLVKYAITDITLQVHYVQAFSFKLNGYTFYLIKNIDAEKKLSMVCIDATVKLMETFLIINIF